ncbi:MAG: alpha/beta hydrolase [Actinomycetota bacterium]|nr:alpha/beta hydrolase [Actinomycetota bacterium]
MELSRTVEWRGRSVAWDRLGSGPAVVMCHGTPWSSTVWVPFAEALSQEFTVYLWDMPGYGRSSKHSGHAVDLGLQAELFTDLLTHWDLRAPHVVAHDFGGAVSLGAHLLHDAPYSSLALVDVVALRPWGSEFFRRISQNEEAFAAQPPAIHRAVLEAYIAGASHCGLSSAQMASLTSPWLSAEGQRAFYRQIAEADERFTDDIQDRYSEIDIPVKIVWGRDDGWIPVERATELARLIPGAEIELIAGAGHLVQYDAPVHLAIALQRWLGRQSGATG